MSKVIQIFKPAESEVTEMLRERDNRRASKAVERYLKEVKSEIKNKIKKVS